MVKDELLSDSVTVDPPVGAAAERVTVQVELPPDMTLVYEQAKLVTVTVAEGVMVTEAVAEPPLSVAFTVTDWLEVTVPAVTVKLPVVTPAPNATDAGVVSAELLSDSVALNPPAGAAPDSVTVQVEVPPDIKLAGEQASEETVTCGDTVRVAVFETLFNVAVTVTD